MASQISHVVHGKKIFDRIDHSRLNWPEFVVATIFPDIRSLAGIDRNLTHDVNAKEEDIPTDDSFESGMFVHSLVDLKRSRILDKLGIYKSQEGNWAFDSALKLREDWLFYDEYRDWPETIRNLEIIYPEEIKITNNEEVVIKYHDFLKKYFAQRPDINIWKKLMVFGKIDEDKQGEITEYYKMIQDSDKCDRLLYKMKEEI